MNSFKTHLWRIASYFSFLVGREKSVWNKNSSSRVNSSPLHYYSRAGKTNRHWSLRTHIHHETRDWIFINFIMAFLTTSLQYSQHTALETKSFSPTVHNPRTIGWYQKHNSPRLKSIHCRFRSRLSKQPIQRTREPSTMTRPQYLRRVCLRISSQPPPLPSPTPTIIPGSETLLFANPNICYSFWREFSWLELKKLSSTSPTNDHMEERAGLRGSEGSVFGYLNGPAVSS